MTTSRSTWKNFERQVASNINGVRIYFSGSMGRNMSLFNGDAVNDFILAECKYSGTVSKTKGPFIRFQKSYLKALEDEANKVNKIPILVFRYKRIDVKGCFLKRDLYTKFQFVPGTQIELDQFPYKNDKKTFNIFASQIESEKHWKYNGSWVIIPWSQFLLYANKLNLLIGTETKKKFGVVENPNL